jgi:hypothetical protein
MRSLRTLAIDGREKEFQGIGGAQGHRFGQRRGRTQSGEI